MSSIIFKRLAITVALILGLVQYTSAQVAFVNSTSGFCTEGNCTSGTTLTVSHNATGANAMAVGIFIGCGTGETAPTISTVTYAAQSLSAVTTESPVAARIGAIWALPAGTSPTTGTNNLVVVLSSDLGACDQAILGAQIITASGVDGTTLFTSFGDNSGSGTSATLTLGSSGSSDMTVSFVCAGNGITSTSETERGPKITDVTNSCGSSHSATASNDINLSWTIPNDSWITLGGALKASGGGGGPTCSGALVTRGIGGC